MNNLFKKQTGYIILSVAGLLLFLFSSYCLAEVEATLSYAPHFKIYFDAGLDAPMLGTEQSGDAIFDFVAQVRSALVNAYDNYAELPGSNTEGLKLPEDTDVFVNDWGPEKTAEWVWRSGDIEIPVTYSNLQELQHDAAHELFHAVQNQYISFITMNSYRWWMEATADYAAAYIGTGHGLNSKLPLDYIKKPLTTEEKNHMYQTAYFIKYLTDRGMNFKDLFESTVNSSDGVFKALNNYLNTRGENLPDIYSEFVIDFILDSGRITRAAIKDSLYEDLADYKEEFNYLYSDTESRAVTVKGNGTTDITAYAITSSNNNAFRINISALQPTTGVNVDFIVTSSKDINDVVRKGRLESGKSLEMKVKDGFYIYFVVTNTYSNSGTVTVVINKPAGYSSYRKDRKVKIYNQTFSADVIFEVMCSQPFSIVSEETYYNGQLYRLTIRMIDELPSDRALVVNASADVSNLSYINRDDIVPKISEAYWQHGVKKTNDKNVVMSISANDPPPGRLIYSIVITHINPQTNEEIWAGGGHLIDLVVEY